MKLKIGNVVIDPFLMNASGPRCTEFHELMAIACSGAGAVVAKSTTLLPREGNPEPRYASDNFGAIQSMGLPNPGYEEMGRRIHALKEETSKPVIASVAGFSANEYKKISSYLVKEGADLVELNFSCPNVRKPMVAYDPKQCAAVLKKMNLDVPFGVKVPYYPDVLLQENISEIFESSGVSFITAINSVGNSLLLKDGNPLIKPVLGGLCGDYIKPISLGTVYTFRKFFNRRTKIIGVGGIREAEDVSDFLSAGADGVQVGCSFEKHGPEIFSRIISEMKK